MRVSRLQAALLRVALAALVASVAVPDAWALGGCKARIKKKDGSIKVNAQGVAGTLRWGWSPGTAVFSFDNEAACHAGGAAKGCIPAPEGDPMRITPPPLCTLYLEDDTDSCTAFVSGCVPAARPGCPPDTEQVGSWCIDRVGMINPPLEFGEAVSYCQAKGRSLCPLEALIECDTNTSGSTHPPLSCSSFTDGRSGGPLWTLTPNARDGENFFGHMTVYMGNNEANVQSTTIGSLYGAICCQRLGGQ